APSADRRAYRLCNLVLILQSLQAGIRRRARPIPPPAQRAPHIRSHRPAPALTNKAHARQLPGADTITRPPLPAAAPPWPSRGPNAPIAPFGAAPNGIRHTAAAAHLA